MPSTHFRASRMLGLLEAVSHGDGGARLLPAGGGQACPCYAFNWNSLWASVAHQLLKRARPVPQGLARRYCQIIRPERDTHPAGVMR